MQWHLEKVWDANHPSAGQTAPPTTLYAYDALNRLETVTQPWTGPGGGDAVTTYGYDVQDHLISVEDAEGNVTTYTYSDRDLLTEQVSPVSGTETSTYSEHGERDSATDARGISATFVIDELDRVTQAQYPDTSLNTTWTHDDPGVTCSKGRLTRIQRTGSDVAYEHDCFGRVTMDVSSASTTTRTATAPG